MTGPRLAMFILAALYSCSQIEGATAVFHARQIPGSIAGATGLIVDFGGNSWFTEFDRNRIGSITTSGQYREYVVPTVDSGPRGIVQKYDGTIWFTEFKAGKIGKLTLDGQITEYIIPTPGSAPWAITWGERWIWFTESATNKIGRIDPGGTIEEFPLSANSDPRGMAQGDSFDPCFAEFGTNRIGCINRSGMIREYAVPTANAGVEQVGCWTDFGDIWFTETTANAIGVRHANGLFEEFPLPTASSGLRDLSTDYYGGGAWFTEETAGQVGFVARDGRITEYPLSDRADRPRGIFVSGGTFFLESASNQVVELEPDVVLVAGAGIADPWRTELRFSGTEDLPATVFVGLNPQPQFVCPSSCPIPQVFVRLPANGSVAVRQDELRLTGLGTVRVRSLEDGVLPSVRARIFDGVLPSRSIDLPTIRLSTLAALNPQGLSFPGAVANGGAHANLLLSEVSQRTPLSVRVDLFTSDGFRLATRSYDIAAGRSVYLGDIIRQLGISDLSDGQIRVSKLGDQGLLWGYLATVNSDGAFSIFSGLNP